MADGLSAFGLPPQQNAPPLPPPAPVQPNYPIAAPGTVDAGASPFMGQRLPPAASVPPLPPAPPVATAPTNNGPRGLGTPPAQDEPHPLTLPEALQQWAQVNGRKPTADEFDQIANDYRTNTFVPTITKLKGVKSDAIKAEEASFDNQVQQVRNQLYPAPPPSAGGTAGNIALSAGQQFGGRLLNNAAQVFGLAGGGLAGGAAELGVPGAAALRDYLFRGVDPNAKGSGMTDDQAVQAALQRTGADKHLNDPRFAGLIQEITQRAIANNHPDDSASYTTNQWMNAAHQRSPSGAVIGDVAAFVPQTLLGPGGVAIASAAPSGNTAEQQLGQGQQLSPVLKQFAVDSGLNLLLTKLAPGYGKSLLSKILTGAGIGVGTGVAQQTLDAQVNPEANKSPTLEDLMNPQTATQAGIGALLAALHGGAATPILNKLRSKSAEAPASAPAAETAPNATPAEGATPAAAQAPAQAPSTAPADRWTAAMQDAPEQGLADADFAKQSKATLSDFNQKAKLYASTVKNSKTPEAVVDNATALASRNPAWADMSGEQRATLVGDLATTLGKKAGVKPDAISDHLASLQGAPTEAAPTAEAPTAEATPPEQAAPTAQAPLAETPTPPELQGQQPTVNKVAVDPLKGAADQLSAYLSGDQTAVPDQVKTSPIYQALQGAGLKSSDEVINVLRKFNDDGSVKPTAEVTGTKLAGNRLKKGGAAKTANQQIDDQHSAVASTVAEALSDKSTPTDTANKLKATAKGISQKRYNQEYLSALMNDGAPTQSEAKYRNDPSFTEARAALRKGEITSPDQLGDWLKAHRATSEGTSFGEQAQAITPDNNNKQMGALLGAKSVKADAVVARKHARDVHDALVKLGEDSKTIKSMTLGDAQKMLQRRLNGDIGAEPLPEPTKPLKSTKTKAAKAPAAEAPASVDPLEQSLRERLGDKLSLKATSELYDHVADARGGGDAGNLYDNITGLLESGDITKDDAKWLRKLGKGDSVNDLIENNASGESSASLEAQRRLADEKEKGQTRAVIGRDGKVRALHGVDAVDTHARPGEVIVQRNIGKDRWTVLSHGDDLGKDVVEGKVNRAKSDLEDLHNGVETGFAGEDDHTPFGEHTLNMDDVEEINDFRDAARGGEKLTEERTAPLQVKREVNKVIEGIQKGDTAQEAGEKLSALKDKLEQRRMEQLLREAQREKQRGPDYIRSRLYKMISDNLTPLGENDHVKAGDFANWLLEKNPSLGNDLGISIHQMKGAAGSYDPLSRILHLNSQDINPGTAVHELLHASEQLMPKELQDKIRAEYIARLGNKLKQATADGNRWAKLYLQSAMHNYVNPNAEARRVMNTILQKYRSEVPVKDYYKYYDPSEYFANEGTDILSRKFENNGWVGKAKEWMNEMVQHLKNLFGWDNSSAVYKGIKNALNTEGGERSSGMLSRRGPARDVEGGAADDANRFQDINDEGEGSEGEAEPTQEKLGYEPTEKVSDDAYLSTKTPKEQAVEAKADAKERIQSQGKVGNGQRFWEQVAKADYGLEKAMQEYRGKGIEVTPENNVDDASYTKNGLTNEYTNRDFDEVVAPVDDYLSKNWSKFAKNKGAFLDDLNTFFGNMNFIERMKSDHLENAPLNNGAEIDRAEVLEKVASGDLDPAKGRAELQRLMANNGSITWDDWARQQKVPVDEIQATLKQLKARGYDEKSMADLNGMLDNVRDRQRSRLEGAGLVAKDDPWTKFYGWKWYVPLKGSPEDVLSNNFDLASRQGSLRVLNAQLQAMEGRKTEGERPFSRLFVDTSRAAERHAHSYFLDRVYNLAAEHGKEIGAKIYPFEGRPRDGYTNENGDHFAELRAPKNGVIVHDGNQHYVITLPKDSQLLRGLVQMNNVEAPNALDRIAGKGTHILSRLYTTVHPAWQTFSGFARDLTYTPITLAATKFSNPLEAIPFWNKYSKNVLQAYGALPDMIPTLLGKHNALRAKGEADPQSWAGWTQRYMAAGGSNAFSHVFDVKSLENTFTNKLKDTRPGVDGVVDIGKWGWEQVLKYTGNYANFMEAIPRVAAFRTLVEGGASEHDAATQVRKLLDYSQSGIKGRRINSWLAFFRVGATGVDAMRRAFTKPTGGFDYAKAAKWQTFMAALGAVGYMTANMMLGKDDDGIDRIAKLKPETIGTKILIPLPGGKIGGISLGLGLPQIMLSVGALGAAFANGHQSAEDAGKAYLSILARNSALSPGGIKDATPTNVVSALLGSFVPTVARPLVDVATNTNSFGTSIHNDSPNSKAYHSDQGRGTTPKEYKEMANFLRQVTGGTVDYYPEDIRYLIQNYGGQWGTDIMKMIVSDPNKAAGAGEEPNRLASHFIVNDGQFYMQDQLYKTLDNLGDSVKRYNHIVTQAQADGADKDQAKAQAQQVLNRDSAMRNEVSAYGTLQQAVKQYNQGLNDLRQNKLASDQRKQLVRKQLDSQLRQALTRAQAVEQ